MRKVIFRVMCHPSEAWITVNRNEPGIYRLFYQSKRVNPSQDGTIYRDLDLATKHAQDMVNPHQPTYQD